MNLCQYIPPLLAHPSNCFKDLIAGEIKRYWQRNSEEEDFISITSQFIQCLLNRGHHMEKIIPLLQSAASNIDNAVTHNTNHLKSKSLER
jgi:hypothetical protein